MSDDATLVSIWLDAIDARNRDDLAAYAKIFDDNAHIMVNDKVISTTADAHIAFCQRAQSNGLTAQRNLSVSARANVVAFHQSNEFADGTRIIAGGLALFNSDGLITAGRALNRPQTTPDGDTDREDLDEATIFTQWQKLMDAFNSGDTDAMATFYADSATHLANDVTVARNRTELIREVSAGRARGFTGRHPESMCSKGNVLTEHFTTTFADGTAGHGSLVALFADDGQILATRSLTCGTPPLADQPG